MDQTTGFEHPPQAIPYSRSWYITEIVLYCFPIGFGIVVLGLSIALILKVPITIPILLWTMPQIGVSISWSIVELVTICVRRRSSHRGIHPGAHVAIHLLLWLGLCVSVVLNVWILASWLIYSGYYDDNSYYDDYDYYGDDYYGIIAGYIAAVKGLVAFLGLLM